MRDREMAVRALNRALNAAPAIVSLEIGGISTRLVQLVRGQILDDDDCEESVQALESGIFRRYRTERNGVPGLKWLRLCSTGEHEIDRFLEHLVGVQTLSSEDLGTIAVTAAFRSAMVRGNRDNDETMLRMNDGC
jgi:hypothetical protein